MIKSLKLCFQDGSNRSLPLKQLCFVFTLIFFIGCKKESNNPEPVIVTINTDITYQTIAGFGGANKIWGTQFLKSAEAKKAFGTDETGLGLSIFRVRLASDSTEWPFILESVKEAPIACNSFENPAKSNR